MDDSGSKGPGNRHRSTALRTFSTALMLAVTATACASGPANGEHGAAGAVAGQVIAADLDAEIAQYYLQDYPQAHPEGWHHTLAELESRLDQQFPEREVLEAVVTDHGSIDLAALLFIHQIHSHERNREFADCLAAMTRRIERDDPEAELEKVRGDWHILLVPGWLHEDQATTEADFARTRSALDEAGIPHELLPTPQDGTVEENAAHLAARLRALEDAARDVILVSASKSGAEVHYALGHLLTIEDTQHVRAWINAGGLIHGSPLADDWTGLPRSLLARPIMAWQGWSWDSLRSLRTDRTEARRAQISLPDHVLVTNYVGVPMGSQITHGAQGRYRRLGRLGPNDGATLLADALVRDGITVTEPGSDHYFLRGDIGMRTLAMTLATHAWIADSPCPDGD